MKTLLLVDIQNDFCSNGNLAVKNGEMVVSVANLVIEHFELVVASQDWHPSDHLSFASQHTSKTVGEIIDLAGIQQVLWPDHCVQNSFGAELRADLNQKKITKIFQKGYHKNVDSYSSFYDMNRKFSTGLTAWLKERSVQSLGFTVFRCFFSIRLFYAGQHTFYSLCVWHRQSSLWLKSVTPFLDRNF